MPTTMSGGYGGRGGLRLGLGLGTGLSTVQDAGIGVFVINPAAWVLSFFPTQGSSTSSNTAGVLKLKGDGTNNAFADEQIVGFTPGRRYALSYSVAGGSFGALAIGTSQGDGSIINYATLGVGQQRVVFTATASTLWIRFGNSFATELTISGISGG